MTGGRRRFARSEIRGKRIYWLADVTIGARVHHWSTVDLDITSDAGTIHYDGVLDDVSFSESTSLLAVADPARMTLTAQLKEAPELLRAGRDMRQAAEVSRWVEGTTYEQRVPRMRGFVSDPVVFENAIEVTIDAEPFEDIGCIPERTAIVDSSTWNEGFISGEEMDLPYPTIIGNPGRTAWSVYGAMSGSTGRWVQVGNTGSSNGKLLIAGHEVEAEQVILNCDAFPSGRRFVVTHEQDSLGRTVAVVDLTGSGVLVLDGLAAHPHHVYYPSLFSAESPVDVELSPVYENASAIYVGWYDLVNPTKGRGVKVRGVGIREAGDVARYVLGFSTLPIDDGAWDAAKPHLSQFKIDCMINAPVVPWEWLSSMLLPLLPLSIVPGPWGVRPIVLRWDATTSDAVGHFDETTGSVAFDAGIEVDSSNIINKFALKFGFDARNEAYNYKARRSGKQSDSTAYAKGRIVGNDFLLGTTEGFDYLNISSTTRGPEGIYRVVLDGSGAGAASVAYTSATRTVTITYDSDTANAETSDIADAIRAASPAYIWCDDDSGTAQWEAPSAAAATQTLILPDDGTAGDYRCAVSQARLASTTNPTGVIEESTDSPLIYDPNTANAVLEWRAAVYALPHRRVIVVGDCADWEWVQLGDVVTLTSSRLALTNEVATIESLEIHDDGQIIFRCLIIEDPLRHGYTA